MISNIFFVALLVVAALCAGAICRADFRRRIIPDVYLFPLMLIGIVITNFFPYPITPGDGAIAAIFGYAITAIIGYLFEKFKPQSETPIGMGDIKLIATVGLWLGTTGLATSLIVACISGLIWGARKKQKYIPFAPFLIFGGILSLITMMFLI